MVADIIGNQIKTVNKIYMLREQHIVMWYVYTECSLPLTENECLLFGAATGQLDSFALLLGTVDRYLQQIFQSCRLLKASDEMMWTVCGESVNLLAVNYFCDVTHYKWKSCFGYYLSMHVFRQSQDWLIF